MNALVDAPDLNKEVVVGEKDENYKLSVGRGEEPVEKHAPAEPAACEGDADEKMEHAPQGGGSEAKDEPVCVAESSALVPDGEGGAGNEVVVKAPVDVVQVVSEGPAEGTIPLEESANVKEGGGDEVANEAIPDGAASVAVPDGRGDVSDPVTDEVEEVVREGVSEEVVVVVEKLVEVETISGDIDGNNLENSNMENNNSADDTNDLSVDDDPKKQKIADVNASAQAGFGLATGEGSSDVENDRVKLDQTAEDKTKGPDFAVGGEGSSSVEVEVAKLDQTAEDKTKVADFSGGRSADLGKAQTEAAVVEVTRLEKFEVVESELIGWRDSLAGETQNNGGIETNGNEDVGHQNVKKENSALGKHDVTADGDESEEAKSDVKIELAESISEEKSEDHVAGMDQADDVSDEKVHESKDMETDEGFEDDEVHEMSYFEEVLPEDVLSQEDTFSVGDIIWGKIRSHPWWPGQIFNASDSSEKALKYSKGDTFLIAYFGDRTFAWCDESQLKSFWTNFARMEKQSSANAFLIAMDCALEEVARRTELGMTCSCFPEEAYKKLKSPEVENAGIREGITVPDDVGRSLSVASFKPEKFLEYVKELALFSPKKRTNRLELTFVQAQLSAFYSAKGYLNLPSFHIYGGLSGDETELSLLKEFRSGGSVGIATPSPRREEPTTPASLAEGGEGKSHASSSRKRKRLLEESPHRSRKQRSLAELMDMKGRQKKSQKSKSFSPSSEKKKDSESVLLSSGKNNQKFESSLSSGKKKQKSKCKLSSGMKNQKSKSISPSSGKKKKDSDSMEFSLRRGRRRSTSGDAETSGEEALDAASSGKGKKSKTGSNARETSKKKRRRFDSCENVETAGEEAPDDVSGGVSKASKKAKSRLVSPPSGKRQENNDTIATPADSTQKKRISNLSGNIDAETPPLQKSFKIGDRITKVASQLTGPPIIKCNSDASQKDLTEIVKDNRRGSATPLTPRARSDKTKGVPMIDSSSDEMLALLGTAAENPLKGIDSSSEVIDFFTDFRSSLYEKGSSNKRYKKSVEKHDQDQKSGLKTSSDSESEGKKSSDAKPRKGKSTGSKTTVDYSIPEEGLSKTGRKRKAKSSEESPVKKQKFTSQQSTSPSVGLKCDSEREPAVGVTASELSKDLQEENRTGNLDEKSGEECSPTALILTFTEGDTLPSEADLSRIFSRYGPLEESETEVLRKTSRARVVFKKRPDAEVAFSSAGKFSIFGPSLVSYRLRYLSSTSKDSPRSAMRGIKEAASAEGNVKSPFPG